jgi:hypothetical protein
MAWCTKRGRAVAVGRAEDDIEFPFAPVSGPVLAIAVLRFQFLGFPIVIDLKTLARVDTAQQAYRSWL